MRGYILFLSLMTGCGSPLFDHKINARPSARQESVATPSLEGADDCQYSFPQTTLCAQIIFDEAPFFRTEAFTAVLKIWSSDGSSLPEIKSAPIVFHQHPQQCCRPAPIHVSFVSPGQYQLSPIEFHAGGTFDFFVEIERAPGDTVIAKVVVDVADS